MLRIRICTAFDNQISSFFLGFPAVLCEAGSVVKGDVDLTMSLSYERLEGTII